MEEKERYELIGYCSYRDTETGRVGDNFVGVLNEQDQKIKDLETKLAEKEKAIESLQEMNQSLGQTCNNDAKEIERLREQLTEKDKEETKRMEDFEKWCREYYKSNQKAIEKLEQLKHDIWTNQQDDGWLDEKVDIYELTEMIDQQINKLKGETKC